jgi:hypothetical protein
MYYTVPITEIIESILESITLPRLPKKIKVKYFFYNWLAAYYTDDIILTKDDSSRGYTSNWTGIPIEIDNTIENEYYELVYEEE